MDDLDEFYKCYGETLASRLPEIAHSQAQPAFVFISEVEDPKEVLKFIADGQVPEGRPFLVWDNFDEDLDTGGRDNYHTQLKCSFSILQKATDLISKAQVYADARKIIKKALAVMIQDAEQEGAALYEAGVVMEIRQLPIEKIGPMGVSYYGRGVQFSWIVPEDLSLDQDDLLTID